MYEPQISVIIPTFNRYELLEKTLQSINRIDYPISKFEVIVVDDGSTDQTEIMVTELSAKIRYKIIYHKQKNAGVTKARNTGIELSSHEIIAFISDDVTVDEKWLTIGVKKFLNPKVGGVEGGVIATEKEKITPFTHQTEALTPRRFVGANIFFRKTTLEEIGGYDTRFCYHIREDTDIALSILKKGWIIESDFESKVYHPTYKSKYWGAYKEATDGFTEGLLYKKHKDIIKNYRQFNLERKTLIALPYHYYGFVLSLPLFFLSFFFPVLWSLTIACYLASYSAKIYAKVRNTRFTSDELTYLMFVYSFVPFGRLYYLLKSCIVNKTLIYL